MVISFGYFIIIIIIIIIHSSSSDDVNSGDTKTLTRRDYLMVLVTFFIALIAKGNSAGLSVLAVEWLQEFENSKAFILYVPALNFAITSAAGKLEKKTSFFFLFLFNEIIYFCLNTANSLKKIFWILWGIVDR